jgi:hypothetical protein
MDGLRKHGILAETSQARKSVSPPVLALMIQHQQTLTIPADQIENGTSRNPCCPTRNLKLDSFEYQ